MWVPHVLITYEYYGTSYHMSTIIYGYSFHSKVDYHSMHRFIMYASYTHISDSIDARIEKVHLLIHCKCDVQHSYACVHIPHQSHSRLITQAMHRLISMHDRVILVIQSILVLSKYTRSLTVSITFNVIMYAYSFDMSRTIN
jgi:hypothetical protein